MKHLAVWKIYGAFSPCDLATANNLNAETLYKVANATYKFVKGQNRMNAAIWLELGMFLMLIGMNHRRIKLNNNAIENLRAQNLILAKEIDKLKLNENAEETEM
jgi:hypothetical protein